MDAVNKIATQHLSLASIYIEHFKRGFDSVKPKALTSKKVVKEIDTKEDTSKSKKALSAAPIKQIDARETFFAANDALSIVQPTLVFRDRQSVTKSRSAIEEQVFTAIHFRKR